MKKVTIKYGWFFAAGNVYGWHKVDRNIHVFGVGISMDILKANEEIKVAVAGGEYLLNCREALSFIERYRSTKTIRGKRIGIVSKSLLKEKTGSML